MPLGTPVSMESRAIPVHLARRDHLVALAPVAILARRVGTVHPASPARMVPPACLGLWARWAPVVPLFPSGSLWGSVVHLAEMVLLALMARQVQTANRAHRGTLATMVSLAIMVFLVPLVYVGPLGIMGYLVHLVLRVHEAAQARAVHRALRVQWVTSGLRDTLDRPVRWDSLVLWDHQATTVSRARRVPLAPPGRMVHLASTARRVTLDALAQLVHLVLPGGLASAASLAQRDQLALLAAPATRLFG